MSNEDDSVVDSPPPISKKHERILNYLRSISDEHERAIASILFVLWYAKITLDPADSTMARLAQINGNVRKVWDDFGVFNVITTETEGTNYLYVIHTKEGGTVRTPILWSDLFERIAKEKLEGSWPVED